MEEGENTRLEASGKVVHKDKEAKTIGWRKKDPASDPSYDARESGGVTQDIDSEILKRRKIGRWMSIAAAVVMGIFTFAFFYYAIRFAHSFIAAYTNHIENWVSNGDTPELPSVLPFMVPMVPAFFFSVLGLATMITCIRFITAYVNPQDDDHDGNLIERLVREIAGAVRAIKSGGGE
ncbi:MAG: hypothetical protein ACQER5_05590 [Pseudomonadota bacterium]